MAWKLLSRVATIESTDIMSFLGDLATWGSSAVKNKKWGEFNWPDPTQAEVGLEFKHTASENNPKNTWLLIQIPLKSYVSTQLFTCWYLSFIIYKTIVNSSVCVCVCVRVNVFLLLLYFFCVPWETILCYPSNHYKFFLTFFRIPSEKRSN